jgi:hypothetical protein
MSPCIKCAQLADPSSITVVYEDPSWVGVSSFGVPGAFQLIARRHIEGLWNLSDLEASQLGLAITKVSKAILGAIDAERVYVEAFGEDTLHAHVLLLARTPRVPMDARRGAFLGRKSEFVDATRATEVSLRLRRLLLNEVTGC